MAITLTRLVFISTTAPTDAIRVARLQATAQLAIGYTVVSCVVPYLRPLMQSYESEEVGHGRADASFQLSARLGSKGVGAEKGKARSIGLELNDVSRLLGPERPGFVRLKSANVERASRQFV